MTENQIDSLLKLKMGFQHRHQCGKSLEKRQKMRNFAAKTVMSFRKSFVCFCTLICGYPLCLAQSEKISQAILANDIPQIILESKVSPENEICAIDAFSSYIDLSEYSYEELSEWAKLSAPQSALYNLIERHRETKVIEIINDLNELPLEKTDEYIRHFPLRADIARAYIRHIINNNVTDCSYKELLYISDNITAAIADTTIINNELANRADEKKLVIAESADDFMRNEKALADGLKYRMDIDIWSYFVSAHKQLNEAYSQIGLVSDNASVAADQYQRLVRACYSPDILQNILQSEVDKYCAEINKARSEHYAMVGKKDYPKFTFKVPVPNIKSDASISSLYDIYAARQEFADDRNTTDIVSGIGTFLFGSIGGYILKGLGDWAAISDLVDKEYSARRQYVSGVHDSLYNSFDAYATKVMAEFNKSLAASQTNYIQNLKK